MIERRGIMLSEAHQAEMWTLDADRRIVRLSVPEVPIPGLPQPLKVTIEFDARTIDAMLERLTILRAQMLPPLPPPRERH
jgi:hypothetical protein